MAQFTYEKRNKKRRIVIIIKRDKGDENII